ncbi:hypothetical protein IHV09_22065 [Fictibacillus sp. 23RED33]|uniref:hypothetical protein n=1 Tax=Fictibacillus sp. 23RED33 TaxID=2745879 RepID=UPI0018CF21E9|nr:hypothetical protein [Fictibacillus sp. 23RED33]MBH0176246.1 hypothetical protein [Fictibacillus sp. 23RED33]
MKKSIKNVLMVTGLCLGIVSVSTAVHAASYDTTVPVFKDFESSNVTKSGTSSGQNHAITFEGAGKLVAWIENEGGSNITNKVTYSAPQSMPLHYSLGGDKWTGKKVHLNLSTSADTYNSIETSGNWYNYGY